MNSDLLGKSFIHNERHYHISSRYSKVKKDIEELVVAYGHKFLSSLYFIGDIQERFEVYTFDILIDFDTKLKNYCLMIYDKEQENIRTIGFGMYPSAVLFLKEMKGKLSKIKQKREDRYVSI